MDFRSDWFDDSDYFTGPVLTDDMIRSAEAELGYRLPQFYLDLLRVKNGGTPRRKCYPTQIPTGWAPDHVEVEAILGIGGEIGIDTESGSRYMISEWGYPDIGIVVGETPSAGHETIMLDYSLCGPGGSPRVVYVDVETENGEPNVVVLASSFDVFIQGLVDCGEFEVK